MPELPEVESTVRFLRERIVGECIASMAAHWKRSIDPVSGKRYAQMLAGSTIVGVERRGKFIVVHLKTAQGTEDAFVLFHLRMSGSLDVVPLNISLHHHDRVVIRFQGGRELRFNDPRKFGRVYVVSDVAKVVGDLGYEPLEESFTAQVFRDALASRRGALKPLLLNQRLIAGVGNIYADEALWRAKMHPLRTARSVRPEQWVALHKAVQEVLREAIALQGTDFGDGVVEMGNYAPKVYGREGKECERCESIIRKIVVGQRGTHLCPRCQPLRTMKKARQFSARIHQRKKQSR